MTRGATSHSLKPLVKLVAAAFALGAPQLALAQEADSTKLDKITVTAERRVTVLDETPAAITALDGVKLTDQGATRLEDLVMLAPNTTFTTGQGQSQLFIRGIGNVYLLAGGDPGVAMYSDGAYVSDQYSSNASIFDIQRIEILRGPQGALYGRNATGGAMNFISARPTPTFQSRVGLLFGNYGRKEAEGFVSGPVTADTSLRFSFQVKEEDGYTENPLRGTTSAGVVAGLPSTTAPDKLDDLSSRAARIQSSTNFAGGGNLRLIAGYYKRDDAGASMPVLVDPVMITQLLYGVVPGTDPRVMKSQGAITDIKTSNVLVNYEQPIGNNLLTFTASWRKSKTLHDYDGDSTEAPGVQTRFFTDSKDKSVDLHVASGEGGPLTWIVGVTALEFEQKQDVRVSANIPLGFLVPGAPLTVPLPGGLDIMLGGNVRSRSAAAYTDVRYAFSPAWSLLAGVRFNRDKKSADEYQNIPAFGVAVTGSPSDSWDSVPGNVGVEYRMSPETLIYGKVSTGFKTGAVNLGSIQGNLVKPEKVVAEEFGFKTEFWERRGTFNIAIFNSDYKDMQVAQVGTATVILANASKARIRGAELEMLLRPVPQLTLSAMVGLMDPTYTDFTNTDLRNNPTQAVNVKGNQLAQVSKQQVNVGAEYAGRLGGYKLTLGGEYAWRSKFFFTEFNTPDAEQDAYGLLNLFASLRPSSGPWKVYGYVRNATDETAKTSLIIASPLLGSGRQVTYTRPREFGLGVTMDF